MQEGKIKFNTEFVDGPATITADSKYIFFGGRIESHNWSNDVLEYQDVLNHFQKPTDLRWTIFMR